MSSKKSTKRTIGQKHKTPRKRPSTKRGVVCTTYRKQDASGRTNKDYVFLAFVAGNGIVDFETLEKQLPNAKPNTLRAWASAIRNGGGTVGLPREAKRMREKIGEKSFVALMKRCGVELSADDKLRLTDGYCLQ